MGRGRAKAKQTKVARQLKYSSGGTDLERLRAELGVNGEPADGEDDDDPYADAAVADVAPEDVAPEDADDDHRAAGDGADR